MQNVTPSQKIDLTLSHGPGAPIFDQNGPHTRIRRAPVRAIGAMKLSNKEIYGQVIDISSGGCLFRTESTLVEGQPFSMRITILDGSRRVVAEVSGDIRRIVTPKDERPLYGCAFNSETLQERQAQKWLYAQALR